MNKSHTILAKHTARGAASVEAMIVLPLFVILFVGIMFTRELQGAKFAGEQEARRCAWEYSYAGCKQEHRPSGCEVPDADLQLTGDLREVFDRINLDDPSLATLKGDLGLGKFVQDLIRDQVVARVTSALTHSIEARTTSTRERPRVFGGGETVIVGKYRLACNLSPKTPDDLLDTAWHKLMP